MKKKILAFILAMITVCSVLLCSCSNDLTDDERRKKIVEDADVAYTISIWLPVNEETKDRYQINIEDYINESTPEAEKAQKMEEYENDLVNTIEYRINEILASKNMSTEIKFKLVDEDQYMSVLKAQMEKSAGIVAGTEKLPNIIGKTYKNSSQKVQLGDSEEYIFELVYPEVLEEQVDIVYIGSYVDFQILNNLQSLYSLQPYIGSSMAYESLTKMIKKEYADLFDKFALPNNQLYANDNYQAILINKNIANTIDSFTYDEETGKCTFTKVEIDEKTQEEKTTVIEMDSILDCQEYINTVIAAGDSTVIPYIGSMNDASGIVYWEDTLISSGIQAGGNATPGNILSDKNYNNYVNFYKALEEAGYAKESLAEGESAAITVLTDVTLAEINSYADTHYIVKTELPVVSDINSMFALSTYSINYDRTMKVLNMLMTNEEIVTLLNYGVQGVDYKVELDGTISNLNTFKLNEYSFGNGYKTYPDYGVSKDQWDYIKQVNYDALISPYINAGLYNDVSELSKNFAAIKNASAEVFAYIEGLSAEDFQEFISVYGSLKSSSVVSKIIADNNSYIENNKADYEIHAPKTEEYAVKIEQNKLRLDEINNDPDKDSEALKAEKAELEQENKDLQSYITLVEKYDDIIEKQPHYDVLAKFYDMQEYKDALADAKTFYKEIK